MKLFRKLAFTCLALSFFAGILFAQDSKKEPPLRTVHGVVTDKADNPIPGSVIFLKNVRTNAVSSRFADNEGGYRFSGLDPNADYEIHAEAQGAKSPSRTVTSLDSRKEIVLNLKIDRKKS